MSIIVQELKPLCNLNKIIGFNYNLDKGNKYGYRLLSYANEYRTLKWHNSFSCDCCNACCFNTYKANKISGRIANKVKISQT
ncbi:MAG: hypothetical protein N3A01_01505 [Bacteroidales bacterium]|nr:hypothetical protein [Bacteroidales bacterium]